jgi:hypothetical protein
MLSPANRQMVLEVFEEIGRGAVDAGPRDDVPAVDSFEAPLAIWHRWAKNCSRQLRSANGMPATAMKSLRLAKAARQPVLPRVSFRAPGGRCYRQDGTSDRAVCLARYGQAANRPARLSAVSRPAAQPRG